MTLLKNICKVAYDFGNVMINIVKCVFNYYPTIVYDCFMWNWS